MKNLLRLLTLAIVCSGLALWSACDSATPTAPSGTILTISANPSQISLNGTSQIVVIGRRPDGNPLNEGTEIFFSTSLGSISPTVVAVDENGVASSTLRGNGRVGTANVTASISTTTGGGGGGEEGEGGGGPTTGVGSATVTVDVGRNAGNVSLQATPATIPESGGTISLLALVRDDQGQPLTGVAVNFVTPVGSLASGGSFINTNSRGEARDTLLVSQEDLDTVAGNSFTVSVEAAAGAEIRSDDVMVGILREPQARFGFSGQQFTVAFEDQSTGEPTDWLWDFGDDSPTEDVPNPTHTFPNRQADMTYFVTLTVSNSAGSTSLTKPVTVPIP